MFDPLILQAIACGFALLFLLAALHKFSAIIHFRAILKEYRVIPEALVKPTSYLVPVIEAMLGVSWIVSLISGSSQTSAISSAALLGAYTLAIAINIRRGRIHIDCGCTLSGAASTGQQLSKGLIARNATLICIALVAIVTPINRTLGVMDYVVLATGLLTTVLLYSAANQLLSNGAAIGTWRNRRD